MKFLKSLRFLPIPFLLLLTFMLFSCDECQHENIVMEIVDPTHNECGYTEYTCPDCDYSYVEEFLDPLPHTYKKTVTEPTCTKEGQTLYACECGYSYVADIVAPLGHSYDKTITEPSCNKGGSTKYTCQRCNESYVSDVTDALGHTFTNTVTAPTCTSQGYTTHKCDCGYSFKDAFVKPLDHTFAEKVTPPSCTEQGYTTYTCNCGYTYVDEYTSPLDHTFTETVTEPTCTDEGFTTFICSCGYRYDSNFVKPTGHTYSETVTAPTCTDQGYTTYTCKCGFSFKDNFTAPIPHKFEQAVTAPTCTEEGYTSYTCDCGYTFVSSTVKPNGHNFIELKTAPTCTKQGFTVHTCECGYSYTDDYVEPVPHLFEQIITDPSCTEEGYTTYTCDCGYTFKDGFTPLLPHDFTPEVLSESTCTQSGETKFTCTCGESYTVTTKPNGHDYEKHITMPTLSDMGYTVYTCQSCDHTYTGDLTFYSDIVSGAHVSEPAVIAQGIDISYYNYKTDAEGNYVSLDWESIKNAGITYVIIRIGDASVGIDPTFEKSYTEAKEAGLDIGFYFYTRAMSVEEIKLEVNLVLSALKGKQFEYPVYLDLEDETQKDIDNSVLNEMCVTFFTALQRAGYYTGLYVNHEWLHNEIDTETALSRFDIWYARHTSVEEGIKIEWAESYGKPFGMWQYSDSGTIDGINDTVFDFNYCYKDYPSIIKEYGFNGYEGNFIFPDTGKSFVWVTYQGSIKIRSKNNYFTTDNYDSDLDVIGYASHGTRFEVVEQTELYTAIKYNGGIAYISAKPIYVSFEGLYEP